MSAPTQVFKGNAAVVRVNNKKVGECTSSDVDGNTNKADVPMSDGLGISRGFPIGTITISTFQPVAGLTTADIVSAILDQDIVQVEFTQGGITIVVTGTGQKFGLKSQVDKGMTDGSFAFSGVVQKL